MKAKARREKLGMHVAADLKQPSFDPDLPLVTRFGGEIVRTVQEFRVLGHPFAGDQRGVFEVVSTPHILCERSGNQRDTSQEKNPE